VLRRECIKDLGVLIDPKINFYHRVDFLFSHALKILEMIRTMTFFSILYILLMLYFALIRLNSNKFLLLGTLLRLLKLQRI
jgi:hypothetical protein